MSKRKPKTEDPGQYLTLLAIDHANHVRKNAKTPYTWSAALERAPWHSNLPPAWERAFREAYAGRLVELGLALPAKPSGNASGTPGFATKLERRLLSQSANEFAQQDALAKAAGLSWSTWARRKLAR